MSAVAGVAITYTAAATAAATTGASECSAELRDTGGPPGRDRAEPASCSAMIISRTTRQCDRSFGDGAHAHLVFTAHNTRWVFLSAWPQPARR